MLNQEQKQILETLQKPTMELVGTFYEMPKDFEDLFVKMLVVCEASKQTDLVIKNLSSKEDVSKKKEWLENVSSRFPMCYLYYAQEQYLELKKPVPVGIPTSGQFMVYMDLISKTEKDQLMEAQAAARILKSVDGFVQKRDDYGMEMPHLDKPFATRLQRLEHVVTIIKSEMQKDMGPADAFSQYKFLDRCKDEAVLALAKAAVFFTGKNDKIAKQIGKVVDGLGVEGRVGVSEKDFEAMLVVHKEGHARSTLMHRMNQIKSEAVLKSKIHGAERKS